MKILKLRKTKGITQAQLAELCSTTQQQIAKIEKGLVDPKVSTLRRIADALGCEIKDLFLSKKEFLTEINDVIKKHKVDPNALHMINAISAEERKIPSFHPYWEQLEIRKKSVAFKEG